MKDASTFVVDVDSTSFADCYNEMKTTGETTPQEALETLRAIKMITKQEPELRALVVQELKGVEQMHVTTQSKRYSSIS